MDVSSLDGATIDSDAVKGIALATRALRHVAMNDAG